MGIPSSSEDNARKAEEAAFMDRPIAADLAALLAAPRDSKREKQALHHAEGSPPSRTKKPAKSTNVLLTKKDRRRVQGLRDVRVADLISELEKLRPENAQLKRVIAKQTEELRKNRFKDG